MQEIAKAIYENNVSWISFKTKGYYRDDLADKPTICIGKEKVKNNAPKKAYISIGEYDFELTEEQLKSKDFQEFLYQHRNIEIFGDDIKFDMHMLENIGVDVMQNQWSDFFNIPYHIHPEDFNGKKPPTIESQGKQYIKGYNKKASPTHIQEQLIKYYHEELNKLIENGEWEKRKESFFLCKTALKDVYKIEREGVYFDKDKMKEIGDKIEKEIVSMENKLNESLVNYNEYVDKINPNSELQLGQALSNKYNIQWKHFNSNGYIRFDDHVLNEMLTTYKDNEDLKLIKEHRLAVYYNNMYIKGLSKYMDASGKITPSLNVNGTVTGRISASRPNLQGIPKGDITVGSTTFAVREFMGLSKEDKENYSIVKMDYDQQEPRLVGELSKAKNMIKFAKEKKDIHTSAASLLLNIPYEQVTKEQRSKGKTQNLGVLYGFSIIGLTKEMGIDLDYRKLNKGYNLLKKYEPIIFKLPPYTEVSEWTPKLMEIGTKFAKNPDDIKELRSIIQPIKYYLSEEVQTKLKETIALKHNYKAQFPEIQEYEKALQEKVKNNNYIIYSEHGNPRQLSPDSLYKSLNSKIQSTCGDILKIKIKEIQHYIDSNHLKSKIMLTIHDEIDFKWHKDEMEHLPNIQYILEDLPEYSTPFTVGVEIGKDFHNCIDLNKTKPKQQNREEVYER